MSEPFVPHCPITRRRYGDVRVPVRFISAALLAYGMPAMASAKQRIRIGRTPHV